MKKQDIADLLVKRFSCSRIFANKLASEIVLKMGETLKSGKEISLAGFGKFRKLKRKKRQARNPKTGELVNVPARNVVRFFPSLILKKGIN